jgi:hypothetical protein
MFLEKRSMIEYDRATSIKHMIAPYADTINE